MVAMKLRTRALRLGAVIIAGGFALSACGGSGSSGAANSSATTRSAGTSGTSQVLPVTSDPIQNSSTVQALKITSFLVDNNVDATNKPVADHLEATLQNTGSTTLSGFEVFYTFTDSKTKTSESYYAKLPASFTIPAGGKRTVHFDSTGAPDHFPVNKYSLYYTAKNPLKVSFTVSATGVAVQTTTTTKTPSTGENASQ